MHRLSEILRSWRRSLGRVQALKVIILPCCTGALTGGATIAFVQLLNLVQWFAIGSTALPLHVLPTLAWYHVLIVPALGGLIVGPVVDAAGQLVGVISRRDVLRLYSTELLRHEYVGVAISSTEGPGGPRIHLAHGPTLARVVVPPTLAGQSLREANLRVTYNLTVVAVRDHRGHEDRLPDPDGALRAGDVLVVVGAPADVDNFRNGGRVQPS